MVCIQSSQKEDKELRDVYTTLKNMCLNTEQCRRCAIGGLCNFISEELPIEEVSFDSFKDIVKQIEK